MGYVDENLMTGERVAYRTSLHWIIFTAPVLTILIALLLYASDVAGAGTFVLMAGIAAIGITYIRYSTSEFAVTDKRVMIKVGWLRRHTLETLLTKVENIGIDQPISGRLLGFGTLTITGTGGTKEQFKAIAAPMVFRKYVQEQISAAQDKAASQPIAEPAAYRLGTREPSANAHTARRPSLRKLTSANIVGVKSKASKGISRRSF